MHISIHIHVYHVALQERLMEVEPELASNKDKIKVCDDDAVML